MRRTIKKEIFQDNFIKRWTCGAKNHPQGWSWWKRHNRKLLRHKLKGDIDYEWNNSVSFRKLVRDYNGIGLAFCYILHDN